MISVSQIVVTLLPMACLLDEICAKDKRSFIQTRPKRYVQELRQHRIQLDICPTTTDDLCNSQNFPRNFSNDKNVIGKMCDCELDCHAYETCCIDQKQNTDNIKTVEEQLLPNQECIILPQTQQAVYAIADCSVNFRKPTKILTFCLKRSSTNCTLADIPVYSSATNILYKNVFCAACNFDHTSLLSWNMPNDTNDFCEFIEQHIRNLSDVKSCDPNMIQSCDDNDHVISDNVEGSGMLMEDNSFSGMVSLTATEVRTACYSYTAIVTNLTHNFRNVHCAMCNGAIISPTITQIFPQFSDITIVNPLYCGYFNVKSVTYVVSYQTIFEFHGTTVATCNRDELLDSTSGNCRKISGVLNLHRRELPPEFRPVSRVRNRNSEVEKTLTAVCLSISIFSLMAHLLLYVLAGKHKTRPGQCLMSLCFAILLAQSTFLAGGSELIQNDYIICIIMAVFSHYGHLTAFFWMHILALDVHSTFGRAGSNRRVKTKAKRKIICYSLYAWLVPLLMVTMALIIEEFFPDSPLAPKYGQEVCWITQPISLVLFFVMPLGCLLTLNVILFIRTFKSIQKTTKQTKLVRVSNHEKTRFMLYVKLAIIFGLTWLSALLGAFTSWTYRWCVFIAFCGLQGAFILIVFGLKKSIIKAILKRPQSVSNSSRSSPTKTSQGSQDT